VYVKKEHYELHDNNNFIQFHIIVVKLSHKVVVSLTSCLLHEAITSFSLLTLSPLHLKKFYVTLHETTYGTTDVYQCTRWYIP
jgi:hypothetical protein